MFPSVWCCELTVVSVILPFSICIYRANPVIVHHTFLRLWGCDLLHIFYLHHFFLKHRQTPIITNSFWFQIIVFYITSLYPHAPRVSSVLKHSTQVLALRLVIPLICLLSPCEWTAAFAGTDLWPGSRNPLCCEMLWGKKCYLELM